MLAAIDTGLVILREEPYTSDFVVEAVDRRSGRGANCAVYRCEVPEAAYREIRRFVRSFADRERRCKYNLLGLLCVAANIRLERKQAFFCSQFVAAALAAGGIRLSGKPPCLTTPQDFKRSDLLTLQYSGPLSGYFGNHSPKRSQFCYNQNVSKGDVSIA